MKGQTPGRLPAVVWRPSVLWRTARLSWISLKRHGWGKCDVSVIRRISPPRLSHQTPMFVKYIELSSCYGPWCQAAAPRPVPASSAGPGSRGRSLDPFKQPSDPERCTNRPSPSDKTQERTCIPLVFRHELLFLLCLICFQWLKVCNVILERHINPPQAVSFVGV